jgi:hypothetical protein
MLENKFFRLAAKTSSETSLIQSHSSFKGESEKGIRSIGRNDKIYLLFADGIGNTSFDPHPSSPFDAPGEDVDIASLPGIVGS